jgi:gamma-glutamyltranspeptidase
MISRSLDIRITLDSTHLHVSIGLLPKSHFTFDPSTDNYPAGGKRPISSTSPTITTHEDGTPFLILGGAGGSRIFGSVVQAILNVDWGMDISKAIEHARVHDQLFPWRVEVENTVEAGVVDTLREKGHNVTGASRDGKEFEP